MDQKKPFINSEAISNDLILIKEKLFNICNLEMSAPFFEQESKEYEACSFKLNDLNVLYRKAKITPAKIGQFVTLWKRKNRGPIQPFDSTDPIDLFIISARKDKDFGLFIFPKSILITKEIVSYKKEGKRAFRIYPPWDITTSKQAQKTQKWQLDYFTTLSANKFSNLEIIKSYLQHKKPNSNETFF